MATLWAVPTADNWDIASAANYSTSDGGAGGGGAPANGDTVIFKQGTYQPGSSNLDQSTVTLAALYILGGLAGTRSGFQFPNSSNPYKINATNVYIQSERISAIRLHGAFTTMNCYQLRNGQLFIQGGSVTTFRGGKSGFVEIGDDVGCTTFESSGMGFDILADTTSPGDFDMLVSASAKGTCRRKLSTATIDGQLTLADAASIAIAAGSTKVIVGSGGKLVLNNSGAMDLVRLMEKATLTTKGTPGFLTAPTLATLIYHDGATIDVPPNTLTITTKTPVGGFESGSSNQAVI